MRASIFIFCATCAATTAIAQDNNEPQFAPFEVTQTEGRAAQPVTEFEFIGAPVAINAYGRKARARAMGDARESDELRKLSGALDRAARPAVITIEAQISF
jgi:hypothetical protein